MKNLLLSAALLCGGAPDDDAADAAAKEIVAASGVSAGLAVHVGCGDGRLTAALVKAGRFLVHGTEADPERARETLRRLSVYGQASADRLAPAALPYADALVNLLVVDDLPRLARAGLAAKEVLRVLCPRGAAVLGGGDAGEWLGIPSVRRGRWSVVVKPWPPGADDWSHAAYDAAGRGASKDAAFGPLHGVRWVAGPEWPLGTYYQVGNGGMVAAGGRLFCVTINAAANLAKEPEERDRSYHLVARDAHNGILLWSRPLPHPSPREGTGLAHALVAGADRVYLVAGGALLAVDAATGENLREVAKTASAENPLALRGERLVLAGDREVRAFDARSGKSLWTHPAGAADLLVDESCVVLAAPGRASMACLDLETGRKRWEADLSAYQGQRRRLLFCGGGIVTFVGMGTVSNAPGTNWIAVRSAEDGKELWTRTYSNPRAHWPDSVHFLDGLIWLRTGNDRFEAVDPRTGERRREFTFKGSLTGGCVRDIATDRYLIGTRPLNLIDLLDGSAHEFRGGRHACRAGVAVANGMLYTMPHGCKCVSASLRGFLAFAPRGSEPPAGEPELVRGEAAPGGEEEPDAWPTFRHDARRTGRTSAAGPATLRPLWERRLDDGAPLPEEWLSSSAVSQRLTGPVVAGGLAVVSLVNAHRVIAVDARTGVPRWSFTAGGRIDSPPTLFRGLCLFGSSDGRVYALRLSDGALVWRFRAAPADRRIVAFGQLESSWPVTGGVMVDGARAVAIAGRSAAADGGMTAVALEPETGRLLWRTTVTEGGRSDVGVSDGDSVFLGRLLKFDAATGKPQKGGTQGLWGGSNRILDRAWETLSADDRALHWMRFKQGFGGQPAVSMNHIRHTFQPGEGSLVVASPENSRVYAFRVAYIHWSAKKGERNEHAGSMHAWQEGKELWTVKTPGGLQAESLVLAGDRLYAGGPLDRFRRKPGGTLWTVSAGDGRLLQQIPLDARPVSESLAAANGRLYACLEDGRLVCFAGD